MSKTNEYHYIQFPLCLLQETYKDPIYGLNLIIKYGIVYYGLRIIYTSEDIQRQLLYDYVRNIKRLQPYVINKLNDYCLNDKLSIPDTDGFDLKGNFNLSLFGLNKELSYLLLNDNDLKQTAIFNYRIHMASKLLELEIDNYAEIVEGYKTAANARSMFEQRHGHDAMPTCKAEMLLNFRDKNPEELYLLRAYIGIRSLIGLKNYVSSHKKTVLMRMVGCKTNKALEEFIRTNKSAAEEYEKYSRRKQIDKLFRELKERKFSSMLSQKGDRQIYLSVKYTNLNEFADAIVKRKQQIHNKRELAEAREKLRRGTTI